MNDVLIIEDQPLVTESARMLIGRAFPLATFTVCGNAKTATETLSDPAKHWHRIFLDLGIPGAHGLSLARELQTRHLEAISCIVTGVDRPDYIAQSRTMGFLGYLVKNRPMEEFFEALLKIFRGERVFPTEARSTRFINETLRITRRQAQILQLVGCGLSSKEIALRISLAEGTVNNHIAAAMRVLNVDSRSHAVTKAIELGMLNIGSDGN